MGGNIDQIKERIDIGELISGYTKLEKAGANFKARCPFHNEKTPSFFVSPARQNFYCFGCGAKGDIFSFVEKIEGVEFKEALKSLADRAGVELKYQSLESKAEKDKIFEVIEVANKFFESKLSQNKEALKYLTSRGLKSDTIKDWHIGYSPSTVSGNWRTLFNHLQEQGFKEDLIIRSGLAKIGDKNKEPYDVFRDRITFPIFDIGGRIIAFSGRALSKDTEPKYLNSPDTPLFTKSEVLYGLDKAKDSIRKKDYAVLVEGQVDLVMSHQAGIDNTVASSGTAFTVSHLNRLKRLSSRIILAFDGDAAGNKAKERASELGFPLGFEVKVTTLPEGLDPAEIIKNDPENWKDILRESKPAIEAFLDDIESEEKDPRKLGKLIEKKILPMIKLLGSAIEQAHYVSLIARHLGVSEEAIMRDLSKIKQEKPEGLKEDHELSNQISRSGRSRKEELEDVESWLTQDPKNNDLLRQKEELLRLIRIDEIDEELVNLRPKDEAERKKKFELIKERDILRN